MSSASDFGTGFGCIAALAVAVMVIVWVAFIYPQQIQRCEAIGGHIYHQGRAMLCLTEDGRVIEDY